MNLPEQLKELMTLKHWVCHLDKVPKNPITGGNAMADKPETWGTLTEAINAVNRFNFSGIGFQFGIALDNAQALDTSRITGIDLDHVVHSDGSLEPFAEDIIALLDSYTELSPSGTGLHILCKGRLPNLGRKKKLSNGCIIEIYNNRHYFTVTGNVFRTPKSVEQRTPQLKELYERYFSEPKTATPSVQEKQKPEEIPKKREVLSSTANEYFSSEDLSDSELLDRMFDSANGHSIQRLFSGDITSYSSHSEADLALMSHLAYWTNGDPDRMDRLFRQSGLMRSKWNKRHGSQTYGEMTISKALSSFSPYVSSFIPRTHSDNRDSSNSIQASTSNVQENTPSQSQNSDDTTITTINTPADEDAQNNVPIFFRNVNFYIRGYVHDWKFTDDLSRFRTFADRKTGFSNIDAKVSFYPGLYVLGAISSLGKTTFIHQMADQLVKNGEHVLFFSLEQTCLELVTKGISRLMAQKDLHTAVSAIDIRRGVDNPLVRQATEEYASFAEREIILECSFETKISYIIDTVQQFIQENSVLPIVIIDYLQVICPTNQRQLTKDAVDSHVRALKKLQKDNDLVVILVSSLNRQNYLTPIDYESFKESGGIEYTADVIWGLQLSVINDDIFGQEAKLKQKREKVKEAKRAIPRDIEFVCLKNRYGESNYTCKFKYYAQFDLFIPVDNSGYYNGSSRKNTRL